MAFFLLPSFVDQKVAQPGDCPTILGSRTSPFECCPRLAPVWQVALMVVCDPFSQSSLFISTPLLISTIWPAAELAPAPSGGTFPCRPFPSPSRRPRADHWFIFLSFGLFWVRSVKPSRHFGFEPFKSSLPLAEDAAVIICFSPPDMFCRPGRGGWAFRPLEVPLSQQYRSAPSHLFPSPARVLQ